MQQPRHCNQQAFALRSDGQAREDKPVSRPGPDGAAFRRSGRPVPAACVRLFIVEWGAGLFAFAALPSPAGPNPPSVFAPPAVIGHRILSSGRRALLRRASEVSCDGDGASQSAPIRLFCNIIFCANSTKMLLFCFLCPPSATLGLRFPPLFIFFCFVLFLKIFFIVENNYCEALTERISSECSQKTKTKTAFLHLGTTSAHERH